MNESKAVKLKCPECGKQCSGAKGLAAHIEAVHTNEDAVPIEYGTMPEDH